MTAAFTCWLTAFYWSRSEANMYLTHRPATPCRYDRIVLINDDRNRWLTWQDIICKVINCLRLQRPLWFKTERICDVLLPNILNSLHSGNYLSAVWFNWCSGKWWLKIHTVRWLRSLALAPHQPDHFLSSELLVEDGEVSFEFSCSHLCKKYWMCVGTKQKLLKNCFMLIWLFWSKQHKW